MGGRWRDGGWWWSVLDYDDLSKMTIAVDFLDLAVADCVLMGAFPLPRRHGRSRDGAGTTLVDGIEGLVGVLSEELGRQCVYCRHCLCCCIRRGERRKRGGKNGVLAKPNGVLNTDGEQRFCWSLFGARCVPPFSAEKSTTTGRNPG